MTENTANVKDSPFPSAEALSVDDSVKLLKGFEDVTLRNDLAESIRTGRGEAEVRVSDGVSDLSKVSETAALPNISGDAGSSASDVSESEPTPAPTVLTIHLYGNGGEPSMTTMTGSTAAISSEDWSVPFKLGKVFDGWYLDAGCTIPFGGVEEGAEMLELYAGWRELEGVVVMRQGISFHVRLLWMESWHCLRTQPAQGLRTEHLQGLKERYRKYIYRPISFILNLKPLRVCRI